jgi:putative uncharacterized protein (fragment)
MTADLAEPISSQPSGSSGQGRSEAEIDGWTIDYFEGFDASFEDTKWGHYGWGDPAVGHGAMGVMSQKNSFVENGHLVIRTQYQDGQWSAGGASSADAFAASYGRWEVRAKFPRAKGIGYVFLLWPQDERWPPEVDFAEGRVNGPQVSGTYHWGAPTPEGHKQEQRVFDNTDMSGWHTYGAIVEEDKVIFTFDGQEWAESLETMSARTSPASACGSGSRRGRWIPMGRRSSTRLSTAVCPALSPRPSPTSRSTTSPTTQEGSPRIRR